MNQFSRCFRGFCFFLLYGGVATVICVIIDLILKAAIPYYFHKDETVAYIIYAARYVIFLLMFGLRHIENIGYLDEYDKKYDNGLYVNYIFGVSAMASVVPILYSFNVKGLVQFMWTAFYSPISFIYTFIKSTSYAPQSLMENNTIMAITSLAVIVITALIMYPFYLLGRKHCNRDRSDKFHVQISS